VSLAQIVHVEAPVLIADVNDTNVSTSSTTTATTASTSKAAPDASQANGHVVDIPRAIGDDVALQLDRNWTSTSDSEGLLYIHGVNHTVRACQIVCVCDLTPHAHQVKDSLKRFAQLLALGQVCVCAT
jgi:hypothetical protein